MPGFLIKLLLIALVNAFGIFLVARAVATDHLGIAGVCVVLVIIADVVYFARRALPLRYLLPGLIFLLVFQVFSMGYTGYVAFTNYGDGHLVTKTEAIDSLLAQNEKRVEGSAQLPASVIRNLQNPAEYGLAVIIDGQVRSGTAGQPLRAEPAATITGSKITAVPGWQVLTLTDLLPIQDQINALRVPASADAEDGAYRTTDGSHAYLYKSFLIYDPAADTLTDTESGTVYRPNDRGSFAAADGRELGTGWAVPVGTENFTRPFTDARYSTIMGQVLLWTVVFSILSVVITFLVGLALAITMNDRRVRGQRLYRSFFIVPYAFPAFMSALLWSGMLNTDFGFINQTFFGGASIPWLTDPWLAKLSVVLVNLWLGFPYMFLICTGALQSIPAELIESARIDGASSFQIWRLVTLPLLLVSVAPLLIASFAFNFNNFNIIYLLTRGGPPFPGAPVAVGQTDILISMVYQISGLAGQGGTRQYGLASALSIIIFLIVGAISLISFRQTRRLEEIN
jgi:arabinogalactan oligomer / maltooligosaccharide transport system permease protein